MSACDTVRFSGVILAAGSGRRMGHDRSKLLLPLGEEIVLARPVRSALDSRLDEVVIVLGRDHREILEALGSLPAHPKARIVRNPHPEHGRLSSIRAGLAAVEPSARAALFLCGDHPMVETELIDRLLDLHGEGDHAVSYPVIDGRKGHPTVWGREAWPSLTGLEDGMGTGDLAESYGDRAGKLLLEDDRTQFNMDTPEDYARLLERTGRRATT